MAQKLLTLVQELHGDTESSGGLLGYMARRRGKKALKRQVTQGLVNQVNETESTLDELQAELKYLREHRQEQEDAVSKLGKEMETLYSERIETDLRHEYVESLESEIHKSEEKINHLQEMKEYLIKNNTEKEHEIEQMKNLHKKDRDAFEKHVKNLESEIHKREEKINHLQEMKEYLIKNNTEKEHEIEQMKNLHKKDRDAFEKHVKNLESEIHKREEKINHLQGVKEYLAKNSAEKEHEIEQMKKLHKKDRDAFEKVHAFILHKFDQLQTNYENVLRHLWGKCYKCRSSRSSVQFANVNEFSTPEEISLRMLSLRQDNNFSTDGISITNEPNTTFNKLENELYRYKIMNGLLENRITEYEPEYSISTDSVTVESLSSSLSDQSFQEDTPDIKITSYDSIGHARSLNSPLDVYQSASSI